MKKTETLPRAPKLLAGPVAAVVLATALASPTPLRANCLVEYADCVDAASELDSFWKRSGMGIACLSDLVACVQRRLS